MDIDEVHVNKKPKFSQETEAEIEENCTIIDPLPESVTQISSFNIENIPSVVILTGE